ncbi:N-acetylmannosamine-6-phosphate 2-epimerase [Spiroplasma clarkii]|uniref:Putative N-acetylmannosamine-6-phosphate 2-epimerase n=1 Tax=Spiroplasma clarkii TaxID=2139 RepID=A0A2K8KLC8_9MOLU|nr:N-acetylmannosamine-6-phosphate 2-epimerase [Spiroplasma clarkii]ATX71131.1 N-acylglucosamine-6-phosphate 2-epimerase [Spiroplasma clarkii]
MINKFKNKLIISCQAIDDEPLNDAYIMSKMAYACQLGGAEILRLSQAEHIKEAKKLINVPVIGLIKEHYVDSEVFITPTMTEVDTLVALGVEIIALDATLRSRPDQESLEQFFKKIKTVYPNQVLMADCSSLEDMVFAEKLGFDLIATTLRGYTKETVNESNVDKNYEFIKSAQKVLKTPLIVEGGIWEINDAKAILKLGVHAVVVGSVITRPQQIVKHWLKKIYE